MSLDPKLLSRAVELVERRNGVGARGGRTPGWLEARLSSSLPLLAQRLGLAVAELLTLLERDEARRDELSELVRVGETRFYRDPPQWTALRRHFLPALERAPRLRALSAGCSTGEEAWTLAMLLAEAARGRPFRVVGLDRSQAALAAAESGSYSAESVRDLPSELLSRYLERKGDGSFSVIGALRERVNFVARDLIDGTGPGEFDLIVCKNVLIYLAEPAGQRALASLENALDDEGALVVARSEVPRVRSFGMRAEELAPGVVVFRARGRGRAP
jgi:chemotaxis protein methyltransferase CheR